MADPIRLEGNIYCTHRGIRIDTKVCETKHNGIFRTPGLKEWHEGKGSRSPWAKCSKCKIWAMKLKNKFQRSDQESSKEPSQSKFKRG